MSSVLYGNEKELYGLIRLSSIHHSNQPLHYRLQILTKHVETIIRKRPGIAFCRAIGKLYGI